MRERVWATKLLLLLLGGWFFLTISVMYVAASSFRVVDLNNLRNAAEIFSEIPDGEPRQQALRYVAGEFNRHVFATYDWANLGFSIAVLALLIVSAHRDKRSVALVTACVLISASFLFYLTPTLTDLGRGIDFMPRNPEPAEVRWFYMLHGANAVLEIVKLGLISIFALGLVKARPRADGTASLREKETG